MVEPVLLALLVAAIGRLKIRGIFRRWELYPMLFLVLTYIFCQITIFMNNYYFIRFTIPMKFAFLAVLIIIIFRNRLYHSYYTVAALLLYIAGSVMNRIVVAANGNRMPVFPSLTLKTGYLDMEVIRQSGMHIIGDENVRYKWLSDIFDVGYSVMSLGDILIRLCVFMILLLFIYSVSSKTELAV